MLQGFTKKIICDNYIFYFFKIIDTSFPSLYFIFKILKVLQIQK